MNDSRTKNYLIIGGATGYGLSIARSLIKEDATVFIASRNKKKCTAVVEKLLETSARKASYKAMSLDMNNHQSVEALKIKLRNSGHKLNGLFVTAALSQRRNTELPLLNGPIEDFFQTLETNILNQFSLFKYFKSILNPTGSLCLFFSSTAGWHSTVGSGTYNISKSAQNALIINLGRELTKTDSQIKLIGIDPWEARSEMNSKSNISSDHIIPLVKAIMILDQWLTNGTIFTPDGSSKFFPGSPVFSHNLFDLLTDFGKENILYDRKSFILTE